MPTIVPVILFEAGVVSELLGVAGEPAAAGVFLQAVRQDTLAKTRMIAKNRVSILFIFKSSSKKISGQHSVKQRGGVLFNRV